MKIVKLPNIRLIIKEKNDNSLQSNFACDSPSPRVKSASTVSKDGTRLHIFSGYNKFGQAALSTFQSIGLENWGEEQEIVVAREGEHKRAYFSRHASAITLASGDILVTGGMRRETEVFLVDGRDLAMWTPRSSMHHPRSGHSSARIVLEREEKVLVVGGWDKRGVCQVTAEIYSLKDDSWERLPSLPTPRVDFTLKVILGGTHNIWCLVLLYD